jgi:hypothetical protein
MSMSRAFPRKGMRGGPGGRERMDDFVFNTQTDSKATRDTAPMVITMVFMMVNRPHEGWFHCSHTLCRSFRSRGPTNFGRVTGDGRLVVPTEESTIGYYQFVHSTAHPDLQVVHHANVTERPCLVESWTREVDMFTLADFTVRSAYTNREVLIIMYLVRLYQHALQCNTTP